MVEATIREDVEMCKVLKRGEAKEDYEKSLLKAVEKVKKRWKEMKRITKEKA